MSPRPRYALPFVLSAALLAACGGSGGVSSDPILQDELAREAEETSGEEHELTEAERNERRFRAVETRIYEACYDDLDHLDEHAQRRRRGRHAHLLSRRQLAQAEEGVGVSVDSGDGPEAVRPGGVTNVDPTDSPTPYGEEELALIVLEDRFDAFHADHPDPATYTDADIAELEDIGDELHDACRAMR